MTVDIANRLVELRKKHGYSQEKLAEKLGLSRQAVSKWERAEASPDTDNLIMLSRLYGVSLDELLETEAEDDAFVKDEETSFNENQKEDQAERKPYVDVSPKGVHVIDENGDEVHVSWKGIHVNERGRNKVSIDEDGVYVDEEGREYVGKRGRVVVNGVDYTDERWKKSFWARFPFALLIIIAIVIVSFIKGTMHPYWMLLLAIPVVDSLIKAIYYKDIHRFAFPVLAVMAFLWMGFEYGLWHPGWLVFLIIPIWYSILPQRKYVTGNGEQTVCDEDGCETYRFYEEDLDDE